MDITTYRTILLLGSNPSISSSSTVPFWEDSRSRKILNDWISRIPLDHHHSIIFENVSDDPTDKNRPLKMSEIRISLLDLESKINHHDPDKIIALGKTASIALTLLRRDHFAMPHPSGRNRQLNDKIFVENKIKDMMKFIMSF